MRRTLAAFTHRDFRVLWFGSCTSSIGTWMQNVAENWLVLSLTGSAFLLGLDAFMQRLPIMLFTLIGGVWQGRLAVSGRGRSSRFWTKVSLRLRIWALGGLPRLARERRGLVSALSMVRRSEATAP